MFNFGDLFYIDDTEYVFLFADDGKIYAARIIDQTETRQIKNLEAKHGRRGTSHANLLFCYVELSTADYTDHAAHVGRAQKEVDFDKIRVSSKKLDEADLRNIRDEIIESQNLFRPALVEYMKSIFAE